MKTLNYLGFSLSSLVIINSIYGLFITTSVNYYLIHLILLFINLFLLILNLDMIFGEKNE